jgi:hypothetical protein
MTACEESLAKQCNAMIQDPLSIDKNVYSSLQFYH